MGRLMDASRAASPSGPAYASHHARGIPSRSRIAVVIKAQAQAQP